MVYFVSWYLHNAKNDGWAYKVENKYNDKSSAEKAFFSLLGNYVGGDTYDEVSCIMTDNTGFIWHNEHWTPDEPEPNEE